MSDSDTSSTTGTKFSKKMIRDLIAMVRIHRCLWDRKLISYRDKSAKDKAWHDIFVKFEPNFDSFNQAKKNLIGNTITCKWQNARDSYVKSRKGGSRSKPYIYSAELQFLEETLGGKKPRKSNYEEAEEAENETSGNWINDVFVSNEEEDRETEIDIPAKVPRFEYATTNSESPKEPNKEEDDSIVSILVNLIQKEEDEDRAFFKSITPAVKTLSESSKFEFRIQVMKLISNLKTREANITKMKRERSSTVDSDSDDDKLAY